MNKIEKLIDLAKHNHEIDLKRGEKEFLDLNWALDEIISEVHEVKAEMKKGNSPYLEDELGDILWGLFMLIAKLEKDDYVTSFDNIFQRSLNKYQERVLSLKGDKNDDQIWKDVKAKQKIYLKEESQNISPQKS